MNTFETHSSKTVRINPRKMLFSTLYMYLNDRNPLVRSIPEFRKHMLDALEIKHTDSMAVRLHMRAILSISD